MTVRARFARAAQMVASRPERYHAPPNPGLEGPFAKNQRLRDVTRVGFAAGTTGPESLAVAADGSLVSGFADGRIARFDAHGNLREVLANTGGRPLGVRFHPDGALLICDARLGLLRLAPGGELTVLTNSVDGERLVLPDDLDVDRTGRYVYFSDASSRWPLGDDELDLIERRPLGRLLEYDFHTQKTRVLLSGLYFANGVTLGPDDAYVLVVETSAARVTKLHLKGPKQGQHEPFIEHLPGYPDNVRFNGRDRFWIAMPQPRMRLLDLLAPVPAARWCALQFAGTIGAPHRRVGMVLGVDLSGAPHENLQVHGRGAYSFITQALEHDGALYLSSLHEPSLARFPL